MSRTWGEFQLNKSEFSLVHRIQKELTKRERQKNFLPFLKGWQRQCSNTDNKLYCSFPRAAAWLFGWSWNGQDQRDWKSTANNILNRLPPCDISAVAWGCVLQTFNVCACMRVDTNASVYVHRSGTSRILSLAVKIFTFAVGAKPWGRGHEQVWHKIFPISDQKAPHKAQSWRLDFVLQWHRPSWSEQRVDSDGNLRSCVYS